MRPWAVHGAAVALIVGAAGCGGAGICGAAELQLALDAAAPGDVVRMGACRIDGSLHVPSGVVLRGAGPARSTLAPSGNVTVCLEPGTPLSTALEGVTVEADNVAGVAVCGRPPMDMTRRAGGIALRRVVVTATRGWGIYVAAVEDLRLEEVTADGPLDDVIKDDPAFELVVGEIPAAPGSCPTTPAGQCTPGEMREVALESCPTCEPLTQYCNGCEQWATVTAIEGLAVRNVGRVTTSTVQVEGFAKLGVTLVDTEVEWNGGRIAGILGTGLYATRSQVVMQPGEDGTGPAIEGIYDSTYRDGVFGAYVEGGSRLTTDGLQLRGNAGYGIVHFDATAHHSRLSGTGNRDAALWVGEGTMGGGEEFTLEESTLDGNMFAGVVLSSFAGPVTIRNTTISGTEVLTRNLPMTVTAGDGIHIRSTFSPITIESVRCVENHRVGILVDLGAGSTDDVSFSAVTVLATGERFGAVAGRGTTTIVAVPPGDGGWDDGITREGDAVLNDTERFGDFSLDIVDSPAPPDAPNPVDAVGIVTPEC